jgi:hypothetical protein
MNTIRFSSVLESKRKEEINIKNDKKKEIKKSEKISLGILCSSNNPGLLSLYCSYMASFYDLEFFHFCPSNISYENKIIRGKVFNGEKWITKHFNYPDLICDRLKGRGKKEKKVYEELKDSIFDVNIPVTINKTEISKIFKDEEYNIPFLKVKSFKEIEEFLKENNKIVLKPLLGLQGNGVFSVEKNNINEYLIGQRNKCENKSKNELIKMTENKVFIAQKFIESKTKDGNPFDVRVYLCKSKKGNWKIIKTAPKIGIVGKEIVAIGKYGGSYGVWKGFVEYNFGKENYNLINEKIKKVSYEICNKFEEHYGTNSILEIGLDIAIDKNMNLFLIELNSRGPGMIGCEFEVMKNAVEYLIGLYKNKK